MLLPLLRERKVRKVLLGRDSFLDSLELAGTLREEGLEVIAVDDMPEATARKQLFAADLGLSGVDYLVAETGSVAPAQPARSTALAQPVATGA